MSLRVRFNSYPISSTCGPPSRGILDLLYKFEHHIYECVTCNQFCDSSDFLVFCSRGLSIATTVNELLVFRKNRTEYRNSATRCTEVVEIPYHLWACRAFLYHSRPTLTASDAPAMRPQSFSGVTKPQKARLRRASRNSECMRYSPRSPQARLYRIRQESRMMRFEGDDHIHECLTSMRRVVLY